MIVGYEISIHQRDTVRKMHVSQQGKS